MNCRLAVASLYCTILTKESGETNIGTIHLYDYTITILVFKQPNCM